jgi:hypothetical protein
LLRPLLVFAAFYSMAQVLVQWSLGPVARYAMLSGVSALMFLLMAGTVVYGVRTFAKDLYGEMVFLRPDLRHLRAQCRQIRQIAEWRTGCAADGCRFPAGVLYLHVFPRDGAAAIHHLAGAAQADR